MTRRTGLRATIALVTAAGLSACQSISSGLPADGPSAKMVERSAAFSPQGEFPVIELNTETLKIIGDRERSGLAAFAARPFNGGVLRPGDAVEVAIFDTGEEGLFSSTDSKSLALGRFEVDRAGRLNLPFVGRVRAAGASPGRVQSRIVSGLRGRAVSPQAAVTVVSQTGNAFTVNGAVQKAGRFQLTSQGERVLDAIALAGGPQKPAGETVVTVLRDGRSATQTLDLILASSDQNVHIRPGDQVYVRHDPPSFTAFGAVKSPGEFPFENDELTLVEALARAGGLNDDRANPKAVYIFRFEDVEVAARLSAASPKDPVDYVPLIYKIDLKEAASYFIMQTFTMKDGDILYAPNAPLAQKGKILQIFQKVQPPAAAPLPGMQ